MKHIPVIYFTYSKTNQHPLQNPLLGLKIWISTKWDNYFVCTHKGVALFFLSPLLIFFFRFGVLTEISNCVLWLCSSLILEETGTDKNVTLIKVTLKYYHAHTAATANKQQQVFMDVFFFLFGLWQLLSYRLHTCSHSWNWWRLLGLEWAWMETADLRVENFCHLLCIFIFSWTKPCFI